MSTSAYTSDRALFEVYYPPFKAAIEAGVASAMCSYNRINGTHACHNPHTLGHLRAQLNFSGWVVSDWWATHDYKASVAAGMDVSMPGNDGFYSPAHLEGLKDAAAKEIQMVTHVMYGMIASGSFDDPKCTAGCDCKPLLYGVNATSSAHDALARTIAADSVVLLKNEHATLPLPATAKVAVVGPACGAAHQIDVEGQDWKVGDYYVTGGSGRVVSNERAVSVLAGLRAAGVATVVSASDSVSDALHAAASADYVLVCAGATTSEDQDRTTLMLDQHSLLVGLSAAAAKGTLTQPLIVAAMAPGQLAVSPWAEDAAAVAVMFLGGQATGHGWADVLLGRVTPAAKLPVTFYHHDSDARPPGPCVGAESDKWYPPRAARTADVATCHCCHCCRRRDADADGHRPDADGRRVARAVAQRLLGGAARRVARPHRHRRRLLLWPRAELHVLRLRVGGAARGDRGRRRGVHGACHEQRHGRRRGGGAALRGVPAECGRAAARAARLCQDACAAAQ